MGNDTAKHAINTCLDCAEWCNYLSATLIRNGHGAQYSQCIRISLECSALCYSTAQLLAGPSPANPETFRYCAEICEQCAELLALVDIPVFVSCTMACLRCRTMLQPLYQSNAA